MATNEMKGECAMCEKHWHNGMCGQHHWMHVIVKILVALFIFWCGVQFGELKSVLHGGYAGGYRMMSGFGDRNQVYSAYPGMMGWSTTTVAPATPVSPTTAPSKTTK